MYQNGNHCCNSSLKISKKCAVLEYFYQNLHKHHTCLGNSIKNVQLLLVIVYTTPLKFPQIIVRKHVTFDCLEFQTIINFITDWCNVNGKNLKIW